MYLCKYIIELRNGDDGTHGAKRTSRDDIMVYLLTMHFFPSQLFLTLGLPLVLYESPQHSCRGLFLSIDNIMVRDLSWNK